MMEIQKQPPEVFHKKGVLKNLANNFIQKTLQHMCFSVNITKFLKTHILKNSANGCFLKFNVLYTPITSLFCSS